jgi:hypothetical protein
MAPLCVFRNKRDSNYSSAVVFLSNVIDNRVLYGCVAEIPISTWTNERKGTPRMGSLCNGFFIDGELRHCGMVTTTAFTPLDLDSISS